MLELFDRMMDASTAFCAAGGIINESISFILAVLGFAYFISLLSVPFSLAYIAMNGRREKHDDD